MNRLELRIGSMALFILCIYGVVHGHSYSIYLSTPVSPPKGFEWIRWLSLTIVLLINFILLWRLRFMHWAWAIVGAGVIALLYGPLFYLYGVLSSSVSTAPPPGLGPPSLARATTRGGSKCRSAWEFIQD